MSETTNTKRALVVGFFSTIGDTEALAVAEEWLREEMVAYDVAAYSKRVAAALPRAMPVAEVNPEIYTHLVVVCGPCWPAVFARQGLDLMRFEHCIRIGVNLTMIDKLAIWNPFDVLLERDSDRASRPDLTFLRTVKHVPVVGTCLIAKQGEYLNRQRHEEVQDWIRRLLIETGAAEICVDTRWPREANASNLDGPEQIVSTLGRLDLLMTNRLHGMVFALKAGIPALVIDGIEGGGKVLAQARRIRWPAVVQVDQISAVELHQWFDWCLTREARTMARERAAWAREEAAEIEVAFKKGLVEHLEPRPLPAFTPRPANYQDNRGVIHRIRETLRNIVERFAP
jgi:hypothetical protein